MKCPDCGKVELEYDSDTRGISCPECKAAWTRKDRFVYSKKEEEKAKSRLKALGY